MKKLSTNLLVLLVVMAISQLAAQTPRMVLVEEATQASCPPCFSQNPAFQNLVNANPSTTIFMAYQVSWPGYDVMNLDNPTEVASRVSYYGITGAPTIVVQGSPSGQSFTQNQINNVTANAADFSMTLTAEVVNGVLQVGGNVEAVLAATGNFKLRIALVEDLITIEDAPGGTNGETEYHHVFKRFIGGAGGIDLANSWAIGDVFEINETLALGTTNIYNFDALEVIAWVQNDTNKFVHQATKVTDIAITTDYTHNGIAVTTAGLPTSFCAGEQTIAPTFKLQNGGNEDLVSADIIYSVNGGEEQTVNWTGSLSTLAATQVTLDPISFVSPPEGSILQVRITNPNGMEDENVDDSALEVALEAAPLSTNTAELTLVTDNYANETYWQVTDDQGNVVASGGNTGVGMNNIGRGTGAPPANAGSYGNNQTIVAEIPLPTAGCYTFTITDYYGDGICCGFGAGRYTVRDNEDNVMFSGSGEFSAREDSPLEASAPVVNVADQEFTAKFSVAPNPIVDRAQLSFTLASSEVTSVAVINNLGQMVRSQQLGKLAAGTHDVRIDMAGLSAGFYLINVVAGQVSGTQKVIVANRF
ncbi:MAG: hypothetical protein DA408_02920 [Bacteroidetes bacterium]|nr:MAG: hypothetical protein C7N36_21575 [Bacteroidota bacterium]PTM14552.1 MAG: hypothetical protein DA408_02920 [Bacteroidota bacterium]